jgi:RNA polymerase sigma factor (sigma-70 family)
MGHTLDPQVQRLYERLKHMASGLLAREQSAQALQTTLVVHDAFDKLSNKQMSDGEFLTLASQAMRQVIIDHVRWKQALKRGGAGRASAATDEELPTVRARTRRDIQEEHLERIYTVLVEEQYDGIEPSELVMLGEQAESLHEIMGELYQDDPPAALVIDMKCFGGLSLQQIAVATGAPKGTVKSQYDRAVKALREYLTKGS